MRQLCQSLILLLISVLHPTSSVAQLPVGRFTDFQPVASLEEGSFQDCCHPISPDGLQMLFTSRGRLGATSFDIFQVSRSSTSATFGSPVRLDGPLNTDAVDGPSSFSSDGLTLYFFSNRGGQGLNDLFQATRPSLTEPFGNPMNLGQGVNSANHESAATVSPDGLTIYFQRTIDGNADLWKATRANTSEQFGDAVVLDQLNSPVDELGPTLSPDGLHLFFSSDRVTQNDLDIYVASRTSADQPFGEPMNIDDFSLGSNFNSRELSFSGLYLSSDWPAIGSKAYTGGIHDPLHQGAFNRADWDIYEVTWVPEPTGYLSMIVPVAWLFLSRRAQRSRRAMRHRFET